MAQDDDRVSVIEQFLITRRRIREIERNALAKTGTPIPVGQMCSFCGTVEHEARSLIQGLGEARICVECVARIRNMLNDASGE